MTETDSNGIQWMQELEDIPKKAIDPLAGEVMRRFNACVANQSSEQVNGKPLRQVLEECWSQQNGVLSCEDREKAESLGVDAIVNITALKTGIANAYLCDSLISATAELPWIISPTPRPSISPTAKDEILRVVKAALLQGGFQDPAFLVEAIRQSKRLMMEKETEKAQKSADSMLSLMADQCSEGQFARALSDFLQYFPVYPYAVFAGPYVTRAPKLVWGKKKPRLSTEVFPTFRAISPFDFCYSPDSPDTQRGTCVFTRTLWTRKQLIDAAKLTSYIQKNVLEVLKETDTNQDFNLSWLSRAPDSPKRDLLMWTSNVTPIEVLTHYGLMSGRELAEYGFHNLDSLEFYNCEIAMAGSRVIQVKVNSDPRMNVRPIYTASFYKTGGDRIAGDGIAQRLRDVERAYLSCLRYLMRNAHNASAPMCEADYKRLSKFLSDEDIGCVMPGLMYLSDSDASNNNQPALRFFNVPSNIPAYTQLMEMFMQLADRITNIPAALHGEAVGSGAMRTFRGMSMLQGNATRALHSAVGNIAQGVFEPMGELLYNINMLYSPDVDIKGDSQIVTKGAEGLLQKEMEKQNAMEILQVLGSVGAQLGMASGMNMAPVISWGVSKLLGTMNVPDSVLKAMQMAPPVQPQQQQDGPQGNGMNPNPNPNPAEAMGPTGTPGSGDMTGAEL